MTLALMLAAVGLALLPAWSGTGRRLAWLAAHRWPEGGIARSRPAAGPLGALRTRLVARPALAAPVCGVPIGLLAGPVPGLLACLSCAVLGRCWQRLRSERAEAAETTALSEAVSAIVAEHAAGATLASALTRAAPRAGRHERLFQHAGRLAALGEQPAAALAGEPVLARIAVAAALVGRSGAAVGEVLAGVRADLQSEQRTRYATAEAVAGARSSALLLAGLPVAGLAMGSALGAHPQRVLLHTTAGLAALSAGVLLNLIGICWVLRLTELRLTERRLTERRPTERRLLAGRARASPLGNR